VLSVTAYEAGSARKVVFGKLLEGFCGLHDEADAFLGLEVDRPSAETGDAEKLPAR